MGSMPNGSHKNFVRLCTAIDSFRNRYGHWPTRVRVFPGIIDNLRSLFANEEEFNKLTSKVKLIPDEAPFIAEDEEGNSYNFAVEGALREKGAPSPAKWLDVKLLDEVY